MVFGTNYIVINDQMKDINPKTLKWMVFSMVYRLTLRLIKHSIIQSKIPKWKKERKSRKLVLYLKKDKKIISVEHIILILRL